MTETSPWFAAPLLAAIAGAVALAVVQFLARVAIRAGLLLDHPNHRSSHAEATPRSGGAAIFLAWMAGVAVVAGFGFDLMIARRGALLAPLIALVFAIGLLDDIFAPRALWKFLGQFVAASVFVFVLGPLAAAPLPFLGDANLGVVAVPLTIFWIVGFMNAFNFMDGVNGIAAACAAFVLFALAVAGAFFSTGVWMVATGLGAVALVGFLPFNFPKGRLFMGDNGSQMIGFLIAASAVGAANASNGALSAFFVPVAMAPFLVDVAFTLVHRSLRGRNIVKAHREHIYQILLRGGMSHGGVTTVYLALTAFSTATAIAMLRLAPEMQWLAPVFIYTALSIPAALVFVAARKAGLLSDDSDGAALGDDAGDADLPPSRAALGAGVSHAAE